MQKGKRISSHFYYIVLPLSFLALFTLGAKLVLTPYVFFILDINISELQISKTDLTDLIVGTFFNTAFFLIMLYWVFSLLRYATYVEYDGETLTIKRWLTIETTDLCNIKHINYNSSVNQITLEFISPSKFGTKISFMPELKNLYSNDQVFSDLKNKIYECHIKGEKVK